MPPVGGEGGVRESMEPDEDAEANFSAMEDSILAVLESDALSAASESLSEICWVTSLNLSGSELARSLSCCMALAPLEKSPPSPWMFSPEARLAADEDVELVESELVVLSREFRVVVVLYELLMRSVLMVILLLQGKVDVCLPYRPMSREVYIEIIFIRV